METEGEMAAVGDIAVDKAAGLFLSGEEPLAKFEELSSVLEGGLEGASPSSPRLRLSPKDTERDIFAMELVVGLMYDRALGTLGDGVAVSRGWGEVGTEGTEWRGVVRRSLSSFCSK